MKTGEEFVHCICTNGIKKEKEFYNHIWVLTNYGRFYSLWKRDFLAITPPDECCGRHRCCGKLVERWVAFYFCSKAIIKKYGSEYTYEAHHIAQYDKQKSNEENNIWTNLEWVIKANHDILSSIQRGTFKIPEGVTMDEGLLPIINSVPYHCSKVNVYISERNNNEHWFFELKLGGYIKCGDIGYYNDSNNILCAKKCKVIDIVKPYKSVKELKNIDEWRNDRQEYEIELEDGSKKIINEKLFIPSSLYKIVQEQNKKKKRD